MKFPAHQAVVKCTTTATRTASASTHMRGVQAISIVLHLVSKALLVAIALLVSWSAVCCFGEALMHAVILDLPKTVYAKRLLSGQTSS